MGKELRESRPGPGRVQSRWSDSRNSLPIHLHSSVGKMLKGMTPTIRVLCL